MTFAISPADQAVIATARFGLGARPGELAAARSDPRGWLEGQIATAGADQPAGDLPSARQQFVAYRSALSEFRDLKRQGSPDGAAGLASPDPAAQAALKAQRRSLLAPVRQDLAVEALARVRLATSTSTPFRERWALFWANHFTVSTARGKAAPLVGSFEREAIRPHVFGRFEDLLLASTTHPGMLLYLDQPRSAGPNSEEGRRRALGLNENLAREVMELHTVGPASGYTQADVTEFARALTGYSIGLQKDGAAVEGTAVFRPSLHEPGARTVMGVGYPEGGAEQAKAVLRDLAASPHTADHLAQRIGAHFVADEPPPALTARLRQAYLDSGGQLAEVARALVTAPEAWRPTPAKFKRPYEFFVSAYRTVGLDPTDAHVEVLQPLTRLGQRPMAAPQPNGWSDQASDWMNPGAIVERLSWAAGFSATSAPATPPLDLAEGALGPALAAPTRLAVIRAETRSEALTLLLMSPEFQRT